MLIAKFNIKIHTFLVKNNLLKIIIKLQLILII